MKKLFLFVALVALLHSCTTQDVKVEVYNPTDFARVNEMVEVDYPAIAKQLSLADDARIVVLDTTGEQVPYQITYDGKLIFQTTLEPLSRAEYTVKAGVPDSFAVKTVGDYYPERVDDIAWENDCIAFRTYGPALQATGEKAYGYDVWVKCVDYPVVAARYDGELNPATVAEINRLKETNPDSAQALYESVSYHVDHGNGLDYYKVGPTLGAGTSALLDADGKIVYPYCYAKYEILDNGPLRFTMRLEYLPFAYGNDTVTESRLVSLDAGSQLNRIDVSYAGLSQPATMVTGIVLHDTDSVMSYDAEAGYAAYADPTDSINGRTFLGMAYPAAVQVATPVYFDEAERTERGAEGHLLMQQTYVPDTTVTYYAGAGWDKWGFDTPEDWFEYMKYFATTLRTPLEVSIK